MQQKILLWKGAEVKSTHLAFIPPRHITKKTWMHRRGHGDVRCSQRCSPMMHQALGLRPQLVISQACWDVARQHDVNNENLVAYLPFFPCLRACVRACLCSV